jgi:hypothetical protein
MTPILIVSWALATPPTSARASTARNLFILSS